jgi:hypothetical protein
MGVTVTTTSLTVDTRITTGTGTRTGSLIRPSPPPTEASGR